MNSHLINHFPMSKGVSKMSEQVNEWMQQSMRAKRTGQSKQMSERCEQMSKWTSKWPSTAVWFLDYSGPQCNDIIRLSLLVTHMEWLWKTKFFFTFCKNDTFFLIVVTHHSSFRWSQHKKVKEISFFVFMSTQSEWRATKDEWCHWKKKSFLQKVKKNFVFHDHSIWVTSDERQMTSLHCGPE